MPAVLMTKDGVNANVPAEKRAEAEARGWTPAVGAVEAGVRGAASTLLMGKDDDLAGLSASISAAVQKDLDNGDPLFAMMRIAGTLAPVIAPSLGPVGLLMQAAEQYDAEKAAPGVADEAKAEHRQALRDAQQAQPVATTAGQVLGGALSGGASSAGGALARSAGGRALAALPAGVVTGAELSDPVGPDGKPLEEALLDFDAGAVREKIEQRLPGAAVGAATAAGGAAAIPAVVNAAGRAFRPLAVAHQRGTNEAASRAMAPKQARPSSTPLLDDLADPVAAIDAKVKALPKRQRAALDLIFGDRIKNFEKFAAEFAEAETAIRTKTPTAAFPQKALDLVDEVTETLPISEGRTAPVPIRDIMDGAPTAAMRRPATSAPPAGAPPAEVTPIGGPSRVSPVPPLDDAAANAGVANPTTPARRAQLAEVQAMLRARDAGEAFVEGEGSRSTSSMRAPAVPPSSAKTAPARAKPVEAPPRPRPRRLSDADATALIRDTALAEGTLDLATLSSKARIPTSQASRALQILVKKNAFREAVAKRGVELAPAPPAPTTGQRVRAAKEQARAFPAVDPEGRPAAQVAAVKQGSEWKAIFGALPSSRKPGEKGLTQMGFIAKLIDEGHAPELVRRRLGLTKAEWRRGSFERSRARDELATAREFAVAPLDASPSRVRPDGPDLPAQPSPRITTERPRTGAIKTNPEKIDALAESLIEDFSAGRPAQVFPLIPITMADGKPATISMVKLIHGTRKTVLGSMYPIGKNSFAIDVVLPKKGLSRGDLAADLRRVLSHEIAHGADPTARVASGIDSVSDRAAYFRKPREVNAYLSEMATTLRSKKAVNSIDVDRKIDYSENGFDDAGKRIDPNDFSVWTRWPEWADDHVPMWREIQDALGPKDQRRFLRVIASAFDEAVEKRKALLRARPRESMSAVAGGA